MTLGLLVAAVRRKVFDLNLDSGKAQFRDLVPGLWCGASSQVCAVNQCCISIPKPCVTLFVVWTGPVPVRVPPCQVTNTGEEMLDPELYDFDPDIIETSQYQIPYPERGPLERQIELRYEEALFEDDETFDENHTNYWFTEPPGMHSV